MSFPVFGLQTTELFDHLPCNCWAEQGLSGRYEPDGRPVTKFSRNLEGAKRSCMVIQPGSTAVFENVPVHQNGRLTFLLGSPGALGAELKSAVKQAYLAISKIRFDQAQYRTDIASRALGSGSGPATNHNKAG